MFKVIELKGDRGPVVPEGPQTIIASTLSDLGEADLERFKGALHDLTLLLGCKTLPREELREAGVQGTAQLLGGHYPWMQALMFTVTALESIDQKDLAKALRFNSGMPKPQQSPAVDEKAKQGRSQEDEVMKQDSDKSTASSSSWSGKSQMNCQLCGKIPESTDLQVVPLIQGNTYRLQLESKGLFCCAETGIKFLVDSPVTIEYELDSWHNHKVDTKKLRCDVVGPVFNVKTKPAPGVVLAVYLPHYLCLKDGRIDKSQVKIGHYKNDNMILETPTKVEAYYVELKNPDFSPLGPLLSILPNVITRYIPVHGAVLIYCKVTRGYKFHLYLMPDDCSVKKVVDLKEEKNRFQWIDKPSQTTSNLYLGSKYIVDGPLDADINPLTLNFQYKHPSELYPYCEIYLEECRSTIFAVKERSSEEFVWNGKLREGDFSEESASSPRHGGYQAAGSSVPAARDHFVDRYRAALISRMTNVDPVLDELLERKLLTDEPYGRVRRERTSEDQMRKLYEYMKSWGISDKDQLYEILEEHNGPLIRDLQHP